MTAHGRCSFNYGRKLTPVETVAESIPLPWSDVGKPEVLMHLGQGRIDFSKLW
jgi:hypothetical protein